MNRNMLSSGLMFLIIMGVTACAPRLPPPTPVAQPASTTIVVSSTPLREATFTLAPVPTITDAIPITGRLMQPAEILSAPGKLIFDVESSGVAAPYGDTYRINRFERPFLQNMIYVSDLDIVSFNLSEDADWYYVSIELSGTDPNNSIGINYGVEIDLNGDGFGDYIIWAHPSYTKQWDTGTVQVFIDSNHDSAGASSKQSDAVFDGNGYDRLVFDGARSQNDDPDLAWVRMDAGQYATVQFAFKKSLIGSSFLIGVISDAGLKDISRFDYNDYIREADAGSPVRTNPNYPLELLYAVDNTCWQAYGIQSAANQAKSCPTEALPTSTLRPPSNGLPPNALPTLSSTVLVIDTTEPAPPTNTELPPPPTNTACEPPTDCEYGYDPDTCQCYPPPDPTEPPIDPTQEPQLRSVLQGNCFIAMPEG